MKVVVFCGVLLFAVCSEAFVGPQGHLGALSASGTRRRPAHTDLIRETHSFDSGSFSLKRRREETGVTALKVIPESIFVAFIVFSLISYIANNIESIKAKQKVEVDKAMKSQNSNINAAQEQQKRAIAEAQRVAEEGRRRAEEIAKQQQQRR